ncbi:MAG: sulfotransferase family protein, partial [bacterium]|nr:sulfotransferase family protein [bacterium]
MLRSPRRFSEVKIGWDADEPASWTGKRRWMIANDRSFAFVHVPKTAGTAIETALASYGAPVSGIEEWHNPATRPWHKHATARVIRDGLGDRAFGKAYKFGLVRHPVDWVFSNYFARTVHIPFREAVLADMPDMESFLRLIDIHNSLRDKSFSEWLPMWIEYVRPSQRMMLCDDGGRILVDFVGRYENLQDDFAVICRQIGCPVTPLPRVNRSE